MVSFPLSGAFPRFSISRRLHVLLALFLAGLFGMVGFTISGIQDQEVDALIIDLAGRQRMLQERHMKEILLARQYGNANFTATRTELVETLETLLHGRTITVSWVNDHAVRVPPAPTEAIKLGIQGQQELLAQFVDQSDAFVRGTPAVPEENVSALELFYLTNNIVARADNLVSLYDGWANAKISRMVQWQILLGVIVGLLGVLLTKQIRQANKNLEKEVHERKHSEQILRESEQRHAQVLDSAMDAIMTIDQERCITFVNRAAATTFHLSAVEAKGEALERFLTPRSWQILNHHIQAHHSTSQVENYIWEQEGFMAQRATGEEFPVEATLSRANISGQTSYTLVMRDLTVRHRMESSRPHPVSPLFKEPLPRTPQFEEIIGSSSLLQHVFEQIRKVAHTDATVLITGETGTGKELAARAIHRLSPRKDHVWMKVNCAGLPSGLVESELFGHEKGAFTGATDKMKGRFELAHGGTILLDEIGELPLETQSKLLRVLQEHEFERVGGTQTHHVDARIIAATNRNLEEAVELGAFRADLFFRLNTFPIAMPPLRELKEDIPLLTQYYVERFSKLLDKRIEEINPAVLDRLIHYEWPGNVRELANILERAVILCEKGTLLAHHLSFPQFPGKHPMEEKIQTLQESERLHILRALEKTEGLVSGPHGAAALLGLNRSTLLSRMRKFGIVPSASRSFHEKKS
ncbi:MAG: sigma 54-interacting transcriptional regulator [Nitrospirales bacterium]|nr:sigma 54-interacting transcriptional regulator [Nitrospirales bacterium]